MSRKNGWGLIAIALLASCMLINVDRLVGYLGPVVGTLLSLAVSAFLLVVFVIVGVKISSASQNVKTGSSRRDR